MRDRHNIADRDAGWPSLVGPLTHAQPPITPPPEASDSSAIECDTAHRSRTWSTRSLVVTGLLSFLGGIFAWHIIGFWAFVSAIVYNPDGTETAISAPDNITQQKADGSTQAANGTSSSPANAPATMKAAKADTIVTGVHRPPANADTLAELLQCAEALKGEKEAIVHACPPLRQRLPMASTSSRSNRQLDAREAARRLATGWRTGIATIETGTLPDRP